jgi:hypothetical protein
MQMLPSLVHKQKWKNVNFGIVKVLKINYIISIYTLGFTILTNIIWQ